MTANTHPVARRIAWENDADSVEATVDLDSKVQHRMTWLLPIDEHNTVDIPRYTFERDGVSSGDPRVKVRPQLGEVEVAIPVFVQKDMHASLFEQSNFTDDGEWLDSGKIACNWRTA